MFEICNSYSRWSSSCKINTIRFRAVHPDAHPRAAIISTRKALNNNYVREILLYSPLIIYIRMRLIAHDQTSDYFVSRVNNNYRPLNSCSLNGCLKFYFSRRGTYTKSKVYCAAAGGRGHVAKEQTVLLNPLLDLTTPTVCARIPIIVTLIFPAVCTGLDYYIYGYGI